MLYAVPFDDEIRVWWDEKKDFQDGYRYKLTLNGKNCFFTKEVYYDFKNLEAGREYTFTVQLVDKNNIPVGIAENGCFSTLPYKSRLDVTKAPYLAIGDGETDNTLAIQHAFDDCSDKEYVYFPMGLYVCGALRMRGDIKIRFDAGASLCKRKIEENL